ncbi:monocarboxylate transporter 10-like [Centruroides sculpturatus]|uniref:monocarboxylate transporter 10-like n=1 Tax=Centruroides sculpturatus TaxID=218467 RepID=UPI000C6C9F87|nr:monocarboxylate transporter 10-like [Centruroides sculpturatus]
MDTQRDEDKVNKAQSGKRYFRSKSVASNDPQSPYYTNPGKSTGIRVRSPSVACVPYYDEECRLKHQGSLAVDETKTSTIKQHYYPEGGWGWVVCVCAVLIHMLSTGLHSAFGFFLLEILKKFKKDSDVVQAVCVGALSTTVTLFLSPVVVAFCRRKSTRLIALFGGIITALGCLFTSFATQFHQMYVSYGVIIGCGVSFSRTTSTVIVCEYFKKKRGLVEIFICTSTGIGSIIVPVLLTQCIRKIGWRLGFQVVTCIFVITILLSVFYRPASLYHPQRRAILHIKCLQKRSKQKEKMSTLTKPKPKYFDFKVLKSRTVQIIIISSGLTAMGISSPYLLLIYEGDKEGIDKHSLLMLQIFLGSACAVGSGAFGWIVVRNSLQCLIAKQYLCQAAMFMSSATILALIMFHEYRSYIMFAWIYGIFYGGYHYSLKLFTLEKVRARNFLRAWSYVEWFQAIPNLIGMILTGYLNHKYGNKSGFYISSIFTMLGSLAMFGINFHRKRTQKKKDNAKRKISELSVYRERVDAIKRPELTCISEEAIADFDEFLDDCITSCNKEEKFLMLSEFENNLSKTQALIQPTRPIRKMAVVTPPNFNQCSNCRNLIIEDTIPEKTLCKEEIIQLSGLL